MTTPTRRGWLTAGAAAAALGVQPNYMRELYRRAKEGKPLPAGVASLKRRGAGNLTRYLIEWKDAQASQAPSERVEVETAPTVPGIEDKGKYVVVTDEDGTQRYVFSLPSHGKPFVRSAEWVQRVWRRYTDGAQINEVCREFGIPRQTFEDLKRALGLTKTSGPFTDEELAERDEDDLHADALRAKERKILTRAEQADWRRVKRDASLVYRQREWVRDVVSAVEWPKPIVPRLRVPPEGHTVVVGASDWHVGKRCAGGDHTLADQVAWLEQHAREVIDRAGSAWGSPERVVLVVGNDLVHSDTISMTTTAGTPQGAQSVGSTRMAARRALELMATLAQGLASYAPVDVRVCPGNHDRLVSSMIGFALEQRFHASDRVTVHVPPDDADRTVFAVGRCPVLLTHGDQEKHGDLPLILARELPEGTDLGLGLILHGHLHRNALKEEDHAGVARVCFRSPAMADDWHRHKGYVGSTRGTTVLRVDPERSLRGVEYV